MSTFGSGTFGGSRTTFGGITTTLPVLAVVLTPTATAALVLTPLQEKTS
jgi:hypothetical protein